MQWSFAVERVGVGVIGLGEVAQIIHLPILESLRDRYRIAAICDVSPTLVKAMGERYGVPLDARHADYRDVVVRDDVDAVFVLTADEYHADCTIAAANHRKHVLVEKPMCLAPSEADAIVRARDEADVHVMVAYMRRFAPAFLKAVEEVKGLDKINYVRVRDLVGRNRLIIDQSCAVLRPTDHPAELGANRAERARALVLEAIGEAPPELVRAYRLLLGLNSHDLSAMRELIGFPQRVLAATQWNSGNFLHVIFDYGDFQAVLETGVDEQLRFDAHLEVLAPAKAIRVQYDTPYIRHLPTTLDIVETVGDTFVESVTRPTFKDPYTHELEYFHEVVSAGKPPKTTPEDFMEDLRLFKMIIDSLRVNATLPSS
jgi:predicted dehydrogenase